MLTSPRISVVAMDERTVGIDERTFCAHIFSVTRDLQTSRTKALDKRMTAIEFCCICDCQRAK